MHDQPGAMDAAEVAENERSQLWELDRSASTLKILTLLINLAVVIYLLYAKRLFGLRGGGFAEERERAAESGWSALERSFPPPGTAPAPARAGGEP